MGVASAFAALGWTVAWLYAPDRKLDTGVLATIGAAFGGYCALLFVLWINTSRAVAITGTIASLALLAALVWRRLTRL